MTAVSVRYRPAICRPPAVAASSRSNGTARRCVLGLPDDVDVAHTGLGGGLGRLLEHAGPGDDGPRPAVAELELDFRRLEQHVHRHDHAAGLENPEIGDQELRDVRQLDRHRVARPQARFREAGGEPVGQRVKLRVRQLPPGVERDRLVR